MSKRQNAAEYACEIILKDSKTLLGRRAHFRVAYPNFWDFIGGKIKAGESAEQALIRKLYLSHLKNRIFESHTALLHKSHEGFSS